MVGPNNYLSKVNEALTRAGAARRRRLNVVHGEFDYRMDGSRPPCPTCRRKFVDDEKVVIVYSESTPPSGDMFHERCLPLLDTLVEREEATDRILAKWEGEAVSGGENPLMPDVPADFPKKTS